MLKFQQTLLSVLLALSIYDAHAGEIVVIAHAGMEKIDTTMVQRIYTGKVIELNGTAIVAVNYGRGALRDRFLRYFLKQDDERYSAYWIVRRFIGKGLPPREVANTAEVISFVQATPGAIAYIDESQIKPEMNVIAR